MKTESKKQTCQLISAKELAKMLSLSKRQIFRMNSCGLIPKSLKISGSIRWKLSDIEQWIAMNCPSRREFEARREAE